MALLTVASRLVLRCSSASHCRMYVWNANMLPGQTLLSTLLDWPWGFTKEGPFLEYSSDYPPFQERLCFMNLPSKLDQVITPLTCSYEQLGSNLGLEECLEFLRGLPYSHQAYTNTVRSVLGEVVRPPRAAETKGQQNKHFSLKKKIFSCSIDFKLFIQIRKRKFSK
jgi:hypothetical protein